MCLKIVFEKNDFGMVIFYRKTLSNRSKNGKFVISRKSRPDLPKNPIKVYTNVLLYKKRESKQFITSSASRSLYGIILKPGIYGPKPS